MLNVACMQKIKIGHRAKFRDKDKCFLQLLFPVRAILRCLSTSGVLRARLLIEILTNFADAYIFVIAWMGYARARLKTLSSLLKTLLRHNVWVYSALSSQCGLALKILKQIKSLLRIPRFTKSGL